MIEKNKIKINEGERRTGKDEMNLIELPFTLLAKRNPKGLKTIERNWFGKGEDGKERKFYKIITGSDKWGLPTFIGEEVYLACMELSYRQDFKDREIHTTQYELINLMGWPIGGSSYKRLIKAFNQIIGLKIVTNAFWDNQNKKHVQLGFGLIDDYCFFEDEKRGRKNNYQQLSIPLGYFHWNEIFFNQSLKKNNIKTLNTGLYFSLKNYISKRLYRFADKKLYNQQSFEIDLFRLAFEKLEMTGNYQYPSKVIEKLQPAIKELETRGIVEINIEQSKTESGYKVCFSPIVKPQILVKQIGEKKEKKEKEREKETEKLAPPTETQAQNLVSYFHTKTDPQSQHVATGKELQQAQDLLDQYGEEKSKQIINYSIKQAQETNFKMQYLGAVLNYIPQAIDYLKKEEERQKQRQAQRQIEERNEEQARRYKEYLRQEIEKHTNSISQEQYQAELEEVKQHLFKQYPWIRTSHWDGPVVKSTVEAVYKDWLIEQGKVNILKFEKWKEYNQKTKKGIN